MKSSINSEINMILPKLRPSDLNNDDKAILQELFLKIEGID